MIFSALSPQKAIEMSGYNAMAQLDDEEPIEWVFFKEQLKNGTDKKIPFGPNCTYKTKLLNAGSGAANMAASRAPS
jgi:hypothetical protein